MWQFPPREDARFVAAMEEVLEVYQRAPDPCRPLVCLDEAAVQLLSEARPPRPCAPGRAARQDSEYVRGGTAAIFLAFAPHLGWRRAHARARRTCLDFAHCVRALLEEDFPAAEKLVLVLDQLNTHGAHSLYKAFAPAKARALAARIEWHHTPRHASWLNAAELELSVLSRQCLQERPGSHGRLAAALAAWQAARNAARSRVQWHFTTQDARIKLQHLYPKLLPC